MGFRVKRCGFQGRSPLCRASCLCASSRTNFSCVALFWSLALIALVTCCHNLKQRQTHCNMCYTICCIHTCILFDKRWIIIHYIIPLDFFKFLNKMYLVHIVEWVAFLLVLFNTFVKTNYFLHHHFCNRNSAKLSVILLMIITGYILH